MLKLKITARDVQDFFAEKIRAEQTITKLRAELASLREVKREDDAEDERVGLMRQERTEIRKLAGQLLGDTRESTRLVDLVKQLVSMATPIKAVADQNYVNLLAFCRDTMTNCFGPPHDWSRSTGQEIVRTLADEYESDHGTLLHATVTLGVLYKDLIGVQLPATLGEIIEQIGAFIKVLQMGECSINAIVADATDPRTKAWAMVVKHKISVVHGSRGEFFAHTPSYRQKFSGPDPVKVAIELGEAIESAQAAEPAMPTE